jgi:hypothetical protein
MLLCACYCIKLVQVAHHMLKFHDIMMTFVHVEFFRIEVESPIPYKQKQGSVIEPVVPIIISLACALCPVNPLGLRTPAEQTEARCPFYRVPESDDACMKLPKSYRHSTPRALPFFTKFSAEFLVIIALALGPMIYTSIPPLAPRARRAVHC